jgi:hypothetical protein
MRLLINLTRNEKIDLERYTNQTLYGVKKTHGELDLDATQLIVEWCVIEWDGDRLVLLSSINLPSGSALPDYSAIDYSAVRKDQRKGTQVIRPLRPAETRRVVEEAGGFMDKTETILQRLVQAEQLAFAEKSAITPDAPFLPADATDDLIDRLYHGPDKADRIRRLYRLWQTHFG